MLTHGPVAGVIFGVILLAAAIWRNNEQLKQVSLMVFVAVGLLTVAVYLSGEGAEEIVERLPDVTESVIEPHEEAAVWSLVGALILGVFSLGGLVFFRGRSLPKWLTRGLLIASLIVSGIIAWTANLGGQINHPEIRSGDQAAIPTEQQDDHD